MTKNENEKAKAEMGAAFESVQSRLRKIESALTLIRSQGEIDTRKRRAKGQPGQERLQQV